jgi:hypothetical protein
MSPGVVCRSIDGYEEYEPLPGAAQTSEEKLLVYVRPFGYKTELKDGAYEAHLVPDFEIRKRGEKKILRQKKKIYEYKPRTPEPPQFIYLKYVISLKGLRPGDYDLTMILHDEIGGGDPATQVVKFRIIPPVDPASDTGDRAPAKDRHTRPNSQDRGQAETSQSHRGRGILGDWADPLSARDGFTPRVSLARGRLSVPRTGAVRPSP